MIETVNILDVPVSVVDVPSVHQQFEEWIGSGEKVYVCCAPVSTVVDCQKDEGYQEVISKADMVIPDGKPVAWVGRRRNPSVTQIRGSDLLSQMIDRGRKNQWRHFFYGGKTATLEALKSAFEKSFVGFECAGSYAPPVKQVGEQEEVAIIDQINQSQADILWVGLGSPKQDFWMAQHRHLINVPIIVGVGAAFDFLAGLKPQAPLWMQKIGLEWFFRLCCEPRRLWRRYLIGNTQFLFMIWKDSFKKKS